MDEGQNLNNGGSGLGAAGGFESFGNANAGMVNGNVGQSGEQSASVMLPQGGNVMQQNVGSALIQSDGAELLQGFSAGLGQSINSISQQDVMIGGEVPELSLGQQAIPSGTGDIVIGGDGGAKSGKSKKGLVIALAAVGVLAAVAVGVLAMWKGGVFGGGKKEEKTALLNSIEQEQKNVSLIESFFEHIYDGDVSFELAYRNEDFVNSLGESITSFNDFCNEIKNSSRNALNEETKNLLVKMNDICEKRTRFYNEMNKIFATFSVVYGSNGIMDTVQELLGNDDEYIASLALQFLDYYTKRDRLLLDIENSGCGSWFSEDVICVNLYDEYYGNEGFVSNGDIVANIAAKIMPIGEYGETFEITNLINELLYENGVLENA